MVWTLPDADLEHALRARRRWAGILAVVTLPCFPVGLLAPGFLWYEAQRLASQRGMRVEAEGDDIVIACGATRDRVPRSTLTVARVRDLVVLSGETGTGRKYWSIPVGSATEDGFAGLGIAVGPRPRHDGRELAGVLIFVVADRILATLAAISVLGAVWAMIGAALGESPAILACGALGLAFALLLARALMPALWRSR